MSNSVYSKGLNNILSRGFKLLPRIFTNYFLAYFKSPFSTIPFEIQVEASSACNLKCQMCSLKNSTHQKKFLKTKDLIKIIKEFNPRKINLTGMGETLLNPEFEKLIKVCHQNYIDYSFISNLQFLNPKILLAIKKYPPQSISISMESGYARNYEQIRFGASFKKLKSNLKLLSDFVKKNNLQIELIINLVYLDFNLKDLTHIYKVIDLANKFKFNKITSQNTNTLSPYIQKLYSKHLIENKFKLIKNYSEKKHFDFFFPLTKIQKNTCYYPWIYPQITSGGEILPCCVLPQFGNYQQIIDNYSFGNIFNSSLKKIWNSPKAIKFRLFHSRNNPCKTCTKNKGIL